MVTVATVFLAVLQFYQPKIEPMVIVVTATPELMPTADLGQGQVSDQQAASEATRTPTVTSVFSPEEEATIEALRTPEVRQTAHAVYIEQVGGIEAYGATVSAIWAVQATQQAFGLPTSTPFPTPRIEDMPKCLRLYLTREPDGRFSFELGNETLKTLFKSGYSHLKLGDAPTFSNFQCPK